MAKRITQLNLATALTGEEVLEISQLSTTVNISGITISALASDNSFNDSADGFITAGFAVGDNVYVEGFATGANNLYTGIITSLTAGKMTIAGSDGDAIVDEAAGASVTITKWVSARKAVSDLLGGASVKAIPIAAGDESTNISVGTAKVTFRMPFSMTLTEVRGSLTTAQPSGSILTIDVNKNGTSILSTKLTIDNTEKTSTTAATPAVISDTNLPDDSEITIDVDQIGTAGAKGLKVYLIGT